MREGKRERKCERDRSRGGGPIERIAWTGIRNETEVGKKKEGTRERERER